MRGINDFKLCWSNCTEAGIINNHELRDGIIRTYVEVKGLSEI